jgi:hypothetical protein
VALDLRDNRVGDEGAALLARALASAGCCLAMLERPAPNG